ncbi:MAG: cytochrome c oxidase subunit I [Candidatus Omnitrophota bacterium]
MANEIEASQMVDKPDFYHAGSKTNGLFGWIFSTDHKRIGILYMYTMLTLFATAAVIGVLMRIQMLRPGMHFVAPQTYNAFFTVHGVIQIFLVIIPGIPVTLGNFFLPLQIGARDLAFPRLNLFSWWLYITGIIVVIVSLFTGGGTPDTGWTFYAPYSVRTTTNLTLAVFGVFLMGFSSTLTGINFIVTIHRFRAPGMTWFRMPLFVWGLYATAWVQVLATPILAITLLLIIGERTLNLGLFDPARGGDPLLYQHLFWIYSHPAVYIMILPGMGIISEVIPCFSRKNIYGYKAVAFSSLGIAFFGYLVWGHHMLTSGMSDTARWLFSLFTFLVAIPSGVKVFNWVSTLYKGSVRIEPPMLFALTFIFLFSIGGLTGLVNGTLNTNVYIHDTYFIVGHFHYVIFGGAVFAFLAGLLYWMPKITGKMYRKHPVFYSWFFLFIGFNMLYFSMLVLGWMGMPRRYSTYLPQFATPHVIATIGSWILAIGLIWFFYELLRSIKRGSPAGPNPWDASTLEWQTASPPPPDNFEHIPTVNRGPYNYDQH